MLLGAAVGAACCCLLLAAGLADDACTLLVAELPLKRAMSFKSRSRAYIYIVRRLGAKRVADN